MALTLIQLFAVYGVVIAVMFCSAAMCVAFGIYAGKSCLFRMSGGKGLPSDAEPLEENEAAEYLDKMQGEWRIIPMEGVSNETGVVTQSPYVANIAYDRAVVKGNKMILSGGAGHRGRPLPVQEQKISFSRSEDGTLYCDKHGSYIDNFDPENGIIDFVNALGMSLQWRRDMLGAVQYPGTVLAGDSVVDELTKLHDLKVQGVLSNDEFEKAKAKLLNGQYTRTRSLGQGQELPQEGDGDDMPFGVGMAAEEDEEEAEEEDDMKMILTHRSDVCKEGTRAIGYGQCE